MKTGINGMLFALVGFMVPFVFVYNPAILLEGSIIEIAIGAIQLLIGTYFLALTVAGYYKTTMPIWLRALSFIVALGFISPDMTTSIAAVALGTFVLVMNRHQAGHVVENKVMA
jgi:TRAP-type uncharacterized transport system fused permease subunit